MNILVVSKYAPVPDYGSNPRWFNLGKKFSEFGCNVCIVTSDSNHGSAYRVESSKFSKFTEENVNFFIIKPFMTQPRAASPAFLLCDGDMTRQSKDYMRVMSAALPQKRSV